MWSPGESDFIDDVELEEFFNEVATAFAEEGLYFGGILEGF